MHVVTVELPYPTLSGNHSTRGKAGGGRYLTPEARAYHVRVAMALQERKAPPGLIHVEWLLAPPDKRERDEDNLFKVVKDALTRAGFWTSDGNHVIASGEWRWTDPTPGGAVLLTVRPAIT
jgi:Holliday junction resolvase RusA-like endonuclease